MEINHFSSLREMSSFYQDQFSKLLAESFKNDRLMCRTIGDERWQQVALKYFRIQIQYSDTVIFVTEDQLPIGVALLRSPQSEMHLFTDMCFQLRTALLLGKHFRQLAKISFEIATQTPNKPHWYINQLAVHPEFQSRGIASKLLAEILRVKKKEEIAVDCEKSLCAFYEKFGFYEIHSFENRELSLMIRRSS